MKTLAFLLVVSAIIVGCSKSVDIETEKAALLKTDRDFSAFSADSGLPQAFLAFMADSATVLSDNAHPYTGREAIGQYLSVWPPQATLTWEPIFADISQSADLGYTIGKYVYTDIDTADTEIAGGGYYITIWKKQTDGTWKFVFDTGTEGLPDDD